jgi:hypothetical protein
MRQLRKYDFSGDVIRAPSRFAAMFLLSGLIANGITRFVVSCWTRLGILL